MSSPLPVPSKLDCPQRHSAGASVEFPNLFGPNELVPLSLNFFPGRSDHTRSAFTTHRHGRRSHQNSPLVIVLNGANVMVSASAATSEACRLCCLLRRFTLQLCMFGGWAVRNMEWRNEDGFVAEEECTQRVCARPCASQLSKNKSTTERVDCLTKPVVQGKHVASTGTTNTRKLTPSSGGDGQR